jgi:hypothetical protein
VVFVIGAAAWEFWSKNPKMRSPGFGFSQTGRTRSQGEETSLDFPAGISVGLLAVGTWLYKPSLSPGRHATRTISPVVESVLDANYIFRTQGNCASLPRRNIVCCADNEFTQLGICHSRSVLVVRRASCSCFDPA